MSLSDAVSILGVIGGIVLFGRALYEWRDAQQWKRAEKLEVLIKEFESDPLLVFGRSVIDWTRRTVEFNGDKVAITNTDALLALRVHTELPPDAPDDDDRHYGGAQPKIRDALDSLLSFFDRLSVAVSSQLVDGEHARVFFRYWLWKLVTYNAHPIDDAQRLTRIGAQGTPQARMAAYIAAYGNIELVIGLCDRFGVKVPDELRARAIVYAEHWVEPTGGTPRPWLG